MSTKTKKKLCWNCEGNVSLEDAACPYCGVSLDITPIAGTEPKNDRFTSPFKTAAQTIIPSAPYPPKVEEQTVEKTDAVPSEASSDQSTTELQRTLLTLLSLLLGTVLIIFGVLLLLFSDKHGIFTLQWHGSYWFIYVLFGAPLVYYGWSAVSKLGDEEE